MTDTTPLLRVAPPSACNNATVQQQPSDATAPAAPAICCTVAQVGCATAQQQPIGATGRATAAQRPSLKALARKVLDAQQGAQQARNNAPDVVAEAHPRNEVVQQQRTRLLAAARAEKVPDHIIAALPDCDAADCEHLTDAGIARYVQILLENHLRARGVAILRPVAQPATRQPPRPAITCASCVHQQQQPDTSDAGMHACAKGHGLRYAREQHACADWKPKP